MANWFYAVNDERQGPVDETKIKELINSGVITPETFIWSEGMADWKKAAETNFFADGNLPPTPKNSGNGLAITGMVLGILSVIGCGPLLGIPALIISIIALVKIKRTQSDGMPYAVTGIITSAIGTIVTTLILLIMAGMLLPALGQAREKAQKIQCMNNMKQIGLAIKQYAIDYDDQFPPFDGAKGLEMLRAKDYLSDPKCFTCPSTITVPAQPGQPLTEQNVSYVYIGGGKDSDSADKPILWDKDGNHLNYGNVLFVDGHVQGVSGKDWKAKTGK